MGRVVDVEVGVLTVGVGRDVEVVVCLLMVWEWAGMWWWVC